MIDISARAALVVEDDPVIRRSLGELLEDERFEVTTAPTLEHARDVLFRSEHRVGVVLLDLALPDGDGEALLVELERLGPRAPAVVLTSAHAFRAVPLAITNGIPQVSKPYDLTVVAATVTVAYENAIRPRAVHKQSTARMRRIVG